MKYVVADSRNEGIYLRIDGTWTDDINDAMVCEIGDRHNHEVIDRSFRIIAVKVSEEKYIVSRWKDNEGDDAYVLYAEDDDGSNLRYLTNRGWMRPQLEGQTYYLNDAKLYFDDNPRITVTFDMFRQYGLWKVKVRYHRTVTEIR